MLRRSSTDLNGPAVKLPTRRAKRAPDHVSVADRLRAAGHEPLSLDQDRGGPQKAIAVAYQDADGSVVAGVLYQLDHRSEEERGIGTLATTLTGADARNVRMGKSARAHVARLSGANAVVVSTRALPVDLAWGDFLVDRDYARTPGALPSYAEHFTRALPYVRCDPFAQDVALGSVSMADLRAKAATLELPGPFPRTKQALADVILTSSQYLASRELLDAWPAWFQNGKDLVLRADQGPTAIALAAVGDAIEAGELGMSTSAGPFSSGIFLFDARDETDETRAARATVEDWRDAQMAALKPVTDELTKLGHRWQFLGNPDLKVVDGRPVTRYWLNGIAGGRDRTGVVARNQPYGWYTLAQLRAEQFIRDAANR